MKLEAILWILALVSVALAIVSPKYRSYCLMVVAVLIVAIVMTLVLATRHERATSSSPRLEVQPSIQQPPHVDFEQFHIENSDKDDPEAKYRIGVAEIRFDQIRPELGSEPGTIRLIRARLYNDSTRFTLTDYEYYLEVQDCVQSACATVYDQRGQAAVIVPAKQARDVVIAIRDGDTRGRPKFKILGTPNIKLSPTNTRAYKTAAAPAN